MEAMVSPCAHCPWRKSNRGKRHPDGWYSKQNLRRLWAGLRSGDAPGMTCHPTDLRNPLPKGSKPVPDGTVARECAGALLLVTRELREVERLDKEDRAIEYFRLRPYGLTRAGIMHWLLGRMQFAGTPLGGAPIPVIEEDGDIALPDRRL